MVVGILSILDHIMTNKHIICFSGGEASAIAAIEVYRRFGNTNLILLNHDICGRVEDADVKRFKSEVASYCGVPVTYANHPEWETKDQFDVVVEAGAFKVGTGTALCTNRLKTEPFYRWLEENKPDLTCTLYYGFGVAEKARIQRRSSILAVMGYRTAFPCLWDLAIQSTTEVGIPPPQGYSVFKHANCVGCLKAGMQHWYIVYCTRQDIWQKALWAEDEIGYSIIKGHYLLDLEDKFERMKLSGIEATEKVPPATFWSRAKKILGAEEHPTSTLPCECAL